ncbi:MAG TPA: UvrD-helicase domain-containing protein, partial [bacterium]|nr:UvrD-helicase domain-containing protein [bacterium]
MIDLAKELNKSQLEAVMTVNGPVLIFAGAGSGKTRVITYRIYNLIKNHNIYPSSILAVTFTNKAANEMKERVEELLEHNTNCQISTFHSFGLRLLRYYSKELNISSDFVIYDEADQEQLIKKVLKNMNIDHQKYKPSSYQNKINRYKDNMYSMEYIKNNDDLLSLPLELEVYEEYERLKKINNALDFADLIIKSIELLKLNNETSLKIKKRYEYIMVDEFQDTNAAQYELLKLLSSEHNNICVVGDDDQSIYSWRGAIMMNILNFEKDYPNTKVIKLEQNYRSTQKILELSNTIIKNNRLRADKTLYTERKFGVPPIIKMLVDDYAEAQYVVDKIKELIKTGKYKYKDFAIFVRTNNQTRLFEEKLRYANIPYIVIGAVSFYSRKEIKDVIAYLKFIVNPSDSVSLERIINTPKRNIGDTTIEKISMFANINKISLFDACLRIDEIKEINSSARERIKAFTNLMNGFINRAKTESVETIITDIIDDTGYRKALEESDDIKDSSRIDNINELINSACEFVAKNEENPTTVAFLEKITMFSETDKIDASKNYVNIMTYHCAKGLEFFVVFMVGVEEHILPHIISIVSEDEAAIEEERRLCYVGITRAKDILYLTHT